MKLLLNLLGGFLLLCFVVCAAPFLLLWYCCDLFAIKFMEK